MTRTTKRQGWAKLTWDDLTAWAGGRSVDRGRSYQRGGRVRDLAVTEDGRLLAWVQGTRRYATTVEWNPSRRGADRLQSRCTCPVGFNGCKHAVALVLEYLEALRQKRPVPQADPDDRRWDLLEEERSEADEGEDFEEEEADDELSDEEEEESRGGRPRASRKRRSDVPSLRDFLQSRTAPELVDLVLSLAQRHPEVRDDLQEQQAQRTGRMDQLIRKARREIEDLTSEPAWANHWTGEGEIPDYSGLQRRLEQLLEVGQADAVLELGRSLLERGIRQVEQSNDEGETASALGRCLGVVFRALPRSSRPNPQKLLYVIDAFLADDYDVCHEGHEILDGPWAPDDWSAVADELKRRLAAAPRSEGRDDFSWRYRRDRLSNRLIDALERAGRSAEVLAVCESEAPVTGSYDRLVRRLIAARRLDDAIRWAAEGIEKTQGQWPGIAQRLREQLREIAEKRRDWPLVAAYRAEDFFAHPSVAALKALFKAAARAGMEPEVRAAALRFLETGKRPTAANTHRTKSSSQEAWPLPPLPVPAEPAWGRGRAAEEPTPFFDVLLDLAIAEKRPDDVLTWYDRLRNARRRSPWAAYGGEDERVADAVAATHPERALEIYRQMADAQIARTSPSAYEEAARYLRKARKVLHALGRDAEWTQMIATIREKNARKRRLLEILDRLDNKRIIEG